MVACLVFLRARRPELAEVLDSWEMLPEALRVGILAMVRAAHGTGKT